MTVTRRDLLAAACAPLASGAPAARPNIVFLFSDDHHYQCLGAAGNPHIRTPHLDRLAAEGVLFSNGAISTPQCAPSRGILLSGVETYQSGLRSNGATSFRPDIGPTAIEQMRRSGYDTAVVGKWHIANMPRECGFSQAPLWLRSGGSKYVDPSLRRGLDGTDETVKGHITDLFTDAAINVVRSAKQPYFLWLAYNAPHSPWYAAEKYRAPYAGKAAADLAPPAHPKSAKPFDWITYYSVITHLDEAVGRFVDALKKSGQWDNTVILFVGDNGYLSGTKGLSGKVHPWEESVRVPFLAAGGLVKRGLKTDAPVTSIDLTATWMDYAGVKPASPLSGRSLRAGLATGKGFPEEGFCVWDDGRIEALAVRQRVEPYRLVRTARHKLIVWESGKQSLFDIVADPGEERDLIADAGHAKVREDLRRRLAARMAATQDKAAAWLKAATA